MLVKIDKPEDFEKYRGKLAGKIVLLGDPRDLKIHEEAESERYDDKKLADSLFSAGNPMESGVVRQYSRCVRCSGK